MVAKILDGKNLARILENNLAKLIDETYKIKKRKPCLAVILVGKDPASIIYVNNKSKACLRVGIIPKYYQLSSEITELELITFIKKLNIQSDIDGILIQLPLPINMNKNYILSSIDPNKDVDGLHPINIGKLAQGYPIFRPCTPKGIMTLLEYYDINIKGTDTVIVGASNIVGRPMSYELTNAGATVTLCHSKTKDLKKHIQAAKILIVATGIKELIKTTWLSSEMTIVDVGIHRDSHGKISGDIEFVSASNIVEYLTPVPGGVGPMTVYSLLENTLLSYNN